MTVAELIKELNELCEDRDPATVEVNKIIERPGNMFGDDWEPIRLDTAGGNLYPFVILIK